MTYKGFPDPCVEFNPRPGAEFDPIHVPVPFLNNKTAESDFANKLREEVRRACGNTACSGYAPLSSAGLAGKGPARVIIGAKISCSNQQCPLIDPPESGDREPAPSLAPLPSLEAEAPIPVTP